MNELIEYYQNLLIKQYWEKTRAYEETGVIVAPYARLYAFMQEIEEAFDLDMATGDRLDVIGRIVGINRIVPFVLAKSAFGFDINPNAKNFSSKFDPSYEGGPFQSKFAPVYTSQQLNDADYRFFIRAKIAVNIVAAVMASDERISIQDAINTVFDGNAYVVDNQDMTLTLYVSPSVDDQRVRLIRQLDLLPAPQAVGYKIVDAEPTQSFGFDANQYAKGFSSKFDASYDGGVMARKVI